VWLVVKFELVCNAFPDSVLPCKVGAFGQEMLSCYEGRNQHLRSRQVPTPNDLEIKCFRCSTNVVMLVCLWL